MVSFPPPLSSCRIAFLRRSFNLGENGLSISTKNGLQLFDFPSSDGVHIEICYSRQHGLYIHRWVSSLEAPIAGNRHGQKVTGGVGMGVWVDSVSLSDGHAMSASVNRM
ncbi:hypothetical protein GQ457_15G005790 [Hibiscus cannabinus]